MSADETPQQASMLIDQDPSDLRARLAGINTTPEEALNFAINAKWGFSGNNDCPYEYDQGDALTIEYDTLHNLASAAIIALRASLALSQELKAAREERPGIAIDWESVAKRNAAEGDEALSRALAAEERANRYQMQYEEECEVHGETRAEVQRLRGELRSGSRPSPG